MKNNVPPRTVVIDYGMGNLRSVVKALEKVGIYAGVSSSPADVESAQLVILPGVGAGDAAMVSLKARRLLEPLQEFIASGRPFFGICLGLQLLMDATDEGNAECLGVFRGRVKHLPQGLKVPHMGWNSARLKRSHPLFQDIPNGSNFYFVHSYYADPEDRNVVAGTTDYGVTFCSVLARDNVVATQFHPEKSGEQGLKLYHNLLAWATLCLGQRV